MSYENAPATIMLDTQCAACGRPLLNAKSVEIELGPDCRKTHGYDARIRELPAESVAEANAAISRIAKNQKGDIQADLAVLRLLGFSGVVARICARVNAVVIEELPQTVRGEVVMYLAITTPYSYEANAAWRAIPGRQWCAPRSQNVIPATEKRALLALLQNYYPGRLAVGPKGPFTI